MNDSLYNTKSELGLRSLFILKELYPKFCSIDRLLYLDYLCLYVEEVKKDAINLHPKYPFQSIEIFEKREIMKKAIFELALKGLVDVETNEGMTFGCNGNTLWLLDSVENIYSKHLSKNIILIINETKTKTDTELKNIIFYKKSDIINEFDNFYPYFEED